MIPRHLRRLLLHDVAATPRGAGARPRRDGASRFKKETKGYKFYLWNNEKGYENMGEWIEKAARQEGEALLLISVIAV